MRILLSVSLGVRSDRFFRCVTMNAVMITIKRSMVMTEPAIGNNKLLKLTVSSSASSPVKQNSRVNESNKPVIEKNEPS